MNALSEKVTPSRIVQRRVGRVRSAMTNAKDKVMGTGEDIPVGEGRPRIGHVSHRFSGLRRGRPGAVRRGFRGGNAG
ncbi:hypothetical protein QRX50_19705 [Amycolatopsis carbonis]|uniref:Uncharacterized protein n=1 Tax=Amycolatopsis carbonis TaxID=715471 RepID=A0A9Y2N2E8_9PSEU|nr:hypothetical protein [Amycolatopsis sp. 2-15]WIX83967.1 hypothetical protein QRX50_19705 [Amycolatopsis sp. 2-15]